MTDKDEQAEYVRLQNEWLEHIGGLKEGDKLLVISNAQSTQGGWAADWADDMDMFVGKTVQYTPKREPSIKSIGGYGIRCHLHGSTRSFPFYVLIKQTKSDTD